MKRIDWFILGRVGSRIGATVLVFYGLIALVESLDTFRFNFVAENHGVPMALVMVAGSAARWTIKTLPVTVLLGAIIGFMDLKTRHELTVIKASGISIWQVVRAPTIGVIIASLVIALGAETLSTELNRQLNPTSPGETSLLTPPGEIWLDQQNGDQRYIMMAEAMQPGGTVLNNVTVFLIDGTDGERIEASEARLGRGEWLFEDATRVSAGEQPARLSDYRLTTTSTPTELRLKLASTEDMTVFELGQLLRDGVSDPNIRAAASMRFIKLLTLPLLLTGSLFIAFAFTAGYRRGNKYGPAVLYGMVLGLVVFVITEMADRAGSAGVLDPTFAALGPAFVAIVIGTTVLLYKEDGRA